MLTVPDQWSVAYFMVDSRHTKRELYPTAKVSAVVSAELVITRWTRVWPPSNLLLGGLSRVPEENSAPNLLSCRAYLRAKPARGASFLSFGMLAITSVSVKAA